MNTNFIENEYTPDGRKKEVVQVEVSGGADSTLLTWLLIDEIRRKGWDTKVQPVTIRRSKPNHPKGAKRAMDRIQELVGGDILLPLIELRPDVNAEGFDEGKFFLDYKLEGFKNNQWQESFGGTSLMPPEEELRKHFKDQSGLGMLEERGNHLKESGKIYYDVRKYNRRVNSPFRLMDKKDIAAIYKEKDLVDSLYPYTRSCESLDEDLWESLEHCGKCWWCEERIWAFGRLT